MLFDYFLASLLFLCGVCYGYRAGHEAGYQRGIDDGFDYAHNNYRKQPYEE
jgi:hypothetical protein